MMVFLHHFLVIFLILKYTLLTTVGGLDRNKNRRKLSVTNLVGRMMRMCIIYMTRHFLSPHWPTIPHATLVLYSLLSTFLYISSFNPHTNLPHNHTDSFRDEEAGVQRC